LEIFDQIARTIKFLAKKKTKPAKYNRVLNQLGVPNMFNVKNAKKNNIKQPNIKYEA
jgi:hypothetical protein